jgi:hypothetical protein
MTNKTFNNEPPKSGLVPQQTVCPNPWGILKLKAALF